MADEIFPNDQHRLHGIINLFGSKLCVLAFFIHTKESELQKGKHKCIFVYTFANVSGMPLRVKKKERKKNKNKCHCKKENVWYWNYHTMGEIHCIQTGVSCIINKRYMLSVRLCTCMLWLNREKEIENGELYFLFRRFVFATLWHRLTVYSSLSKQTNEIQTLCEIVEDARSL